MSDAPSPYLRALTRALLLAPDLSDEAVLDRLVLDRQIAEGLDDGFIEGVRDELRAEGLL